MPFRKEDEVRVVTPIIEGTIVAKRFNDEDDSFSYLVEWKTKGEDGEETHQRWFSEADLEAVGE